MARQKRRRTPIAITDATFRVLLDAAPDAMVIVDERGAIATFNVQAESMFGYSRAELIGQPIELLVPSRYHAQHERHRHAYTAAARTRPMGVGLDLHARRKDGSEFPVEISLSPLATEQGPFVVSAIRDVSDRKQAEAERARLLQERAAHAEASRIKDEFIATLSHELRTPLNAILGWATLLHDSVVPPEKSQKALDTIVRNARVQIQLIEDLLDVSRIVAGKLTLRPRAIDLAEIIELAVEVVRPGAAAKGLAVGAIFESRPLLLVGDPDRLQQVAWNLLSNAVKFCNEHGRVEIRAWSGEDTVHMQVRDTGRGIDPRFLPHVFDRFRQADSSYRREHGGLGLGLALVKSIVELHGGQVSVSSSGIGKGSTFRVSLPGGIVAQPLDVHETRVDSQRARLDDVRVLVVDDQPDERELLATILATQGATTLTADSAAAATGMIESAQPHILITDIAMPGVDGYSLLQQIRSMPRWKMLPAVAVTAHARVEDRERAEAAGFDAYLSKPIDRVALIAVVSRLLRKMPKPKPQ